MQLFTDLGSFTGKPMQVIWGRGGWPKSGGTSGFKGGWQVCKRGEVLPNWRVGSGAKHSPVRVVGVEVAQPWSLGKWLGFPSHGNAL